MLDKIESVLVTYENPKTNASRLRATTRDNGPTVEVDIQTNETSLAFRMTREGLGEVVDFLAAVLADVGPWDNGQDDAEDEGQNDDATNA